MSADKMQKWAERLFEAKKVESLAKQVRIEIEEKLAILVETPERGSKTVALENGLKVTVERGLSYKADHKALASVDIGDYAGTDADPRRMKPDFSEGAYEKMRTLNPAIFKLLSQHVTTTPKKASVTLKLG
jgi:hypothetical protein